MSKIWNGKLSGLFMAIMISFKILVFRLIDRINTLFWSWNLGLTGNNILIQYSTVIRNPKNISIGNGSRIGRKCQISSEFSDSKFDLGKNSFIDKKSLIDFSGNLIINDNVTISEGVMIETHSHGLNPRGKADKKSLVIENNVWIGAHAMILPNVNVIGENSVIGAGSIVTKDVNPYTIIAGNPAKYIGDVPK